MFPTSSERDPRLSFYKKSTEIIEIEDDKPDFDFIQKGCVKLIFENQTLSENFKKLTSEKDELQKKYNNVYNDASKYFSENHKLKKEIKILSANEELNADKINELMKDVHTSKEEVQKTKRERDLVAEEWSKDIKKVKLEHDQEKTKAQEEKYLLEKRIAELTKKNTQLINEKTAMNNQFEKLKTAYKQQQNNNNILKQKNASFYNVLKTVNQSSQDVLFNFEKTKKTKK